MAILGDLSVGLGGIAQAGGLQRPELAEGQHRITYGHSATHGHAAPSHLLTYGNCYPKPSASTANRNASPRGDYRQRHRH